MRMIEKLSILISELVNAPFSKRKFYIFLKNIMSDCRVKEICDSLREENLNDIFINIKDIDKKTIKNCELLLNQKFTKLYMYNKFNFYTKKN